MEGLLHMLKSQNVRSGENSLRHCQYFVDKETLVLFPSSPKHYLPTTTYFKMADKYMLRVTAGSDYDEANQKLVHVNTEQPIKISNSKLDASLTVRVQNYRGEPVNSPSSCAYFNADPHKSDLYSISFSFTPKKDINGHDLVFGNDFDHPIKDKLPPGFGQAMKIAQWFIDPGLYGDAYADEPYLYGPFLSSINTLRVGEKKGPTEMKGSEDKPIVVSEGAEGDGVEARKKAGLPDEANARKKHFLKEQHLKDFTFEEGRNYSCDFFNPYLDFNGKFSTEGVDSRRKRCPRRTTGGYTSVTNPAMKTIARLSVDSLQAITMFAHFHR